MLNRQELARLIKEKNMINGCIDLDTQLTPNGFDLTVETVFEFDDSGSLDFSNKERNIPTGKELMPKKDNSQDKFGWWNLKKGSYKIRANETVRLPNNLMAIAFPRTSLLRMGAFTQTGVWDAGFTGRSEFILVIENKHGIRIKQNARIAQMVFIKIRKTDQGYRGIYQEADGMP